MKLRVASLFTCLLGSTFVSGTARAQDNHAAAVQLYDAGEALSKAGRLAEACPKYGESYRLDPQLGALLHYGDCLERNGQLASAYAAFRDAAEVAAQKNDDRKSLAEGRAQALEPRLSKLSIEVAPDAKVPGLEVLKDGTVLSDASLGLPIALDRGVHRVEARAPGYQPWQVTVAIQREGVIEHVTVPALTAAAATPPPGAIPPPAAVPPPAEPPKPASSGGVSPVTWIAGGVAVAGLATGVAFNFLARSANADAEDRCTSESDGDTCIVKSEDDAQKRQEGLDAAKADRTVSYVAFGVGGAAAAVAIVTLLIPRSKAPAANAVTVSPRVSHQGGGLFVQGSF
jgi:hypothetical protein